MSTAETIAGGVLYGLKIFSEERKRHFQKKYHELLTAVSSAESEHYPDYNNAKIQLAKIELRNFEKAYGEELESEIDKLLSKVTRNV